MIHHATLLSFRDFRISWRTRRFRPGLTKILGTINRWAQMSGTDSGDQGLVIARIENNVVDDTAKEMRPIDRPFFARTIGAQKEGTFAGSDKHHLFFTFRRR